MKVTKAVGSAIAGVATGAGFVALALVTALEDDPYWSCGQPSPSASEIVPVLAIPLIHILAVALAGARLTPRPRGGALFGWLSFSGALLWGVFALAEVTGGLPLNTVCAHYTWTHVLFISAGSGLTAAASLSLAAPFDRKNAAHHIARACVAVSTGLAFAVIATIERANAVTGSFDGTGQFVRTEQPFWQGPGSGWLAATVALLAIAAWHACRGLRARAAARQPREL